MKPIAASPEFSSPQKADRYLTIKSSVIPKPMWQIKLKKVKLVFKYRNHQRLQYIHVFSESSRSLMQCYPKCIQSGNHFITELWKLGHICGAGQNSMTFEKLSLNI